MTQQTSLAPLNRPPMLFGLATGMRSMTGVAALCWAGSLGRTRGGFVPSGDRARLIAIVLAAGEIMGDKMPFAPDRRVAASFALRLVIGALGGAALSAPGRSMTDGALGGMLGAIVGTLVGRAARGATTRSKIGWLRAVTEDLAAATVASAAIRAAARLR